MKYWLKTKAKNWGKSKQKTRKNEELGKRKGKKRKGRKNCRH